MLRRLLIDYRWFDAHTKTPRYEFGYGLSYTTFEYSGLSIEHEGETNADVAAWEKGLATRNHTGASLDEWWVPYFTGLYPAPAHPYTL